MGLRGLTTFIETNSDLYFKRSNIDNCSVLVCANSVAPYLYRNLGERNCAFGGDYGKYANIVKILFNKLKKSNVKPYVIVNGLTEACEVEQKKLVCMEKFETMKMEFCEGFSSKTFLPMLQQRVFIEVALSLGVSVFQCEYEGDYEIAALARQLDWPVISYDSKMYICDAKFIPISTVDLSAPEGDKLSCSFFDRQTLLDQYPGLTENHLPIFATLLSNNYEDRKIFDQFFTVLPVSRDSRFWQTRMSSILNCLKRETITSAINKIKFHVLKRNHNAFLSALDIFKKYCEELPDWRISYDEGNIDFHRGDCSLETLNEVAQLLHSGKISYVIMNLIKLRAFFFFSQIEDLSKESCHQHSIPVILAIDRLVTPTINNRNLKILIRRGSNLEFETWENPLQPGENITLLINSSTAERVNYILQILKLNEEDKLQIESFDMNNQLFISICLYWLKAVSPTACEVHSLLLSSLASQTFCKTVDLDWTEEDAVKFEELFRSLLETSEDAMIRYRIDIVHAYNTFQSLLCHITFLNVLLGEPLPSCQIPEILNGTLYYNICDWLSRETDGLQAIEEFLSPFPNVWKIYDNLYHCICSYISLTKI